MSSNSKPKQKTKQKSLFEEFDPLQQKRLHILDPDGKIVAPEWMPDLSDEMIVRGYKTMVLARITDNRCVSYQRQGKMYTLPVNRGQEAVVGSAMALSDEDWIVQAFREMAALLWRGVPVARMFMQNMGLEAGAIYPKNLHATPMSVPIASQFAHAAGIAHAIRYQGGDEVVLTFVGDGGTSTGDFHESLNWAAVFECPVVFFINNNQWAISAPLSAQTKTPTLAQKAVAYEMPGIQVDGNDMLAVYRASREAVDHARAGKGPVLIESVTYRMGAHTTSDDPTKYRKKEEEAEWELKDPLTRVRAYLKSRKLWDDSKESGWEAEVNEQLDQAYEEAAARGPNSVDEIFSHQFEEMTSSLREQKEDLEGFLKWKEGR